MTSEEELRRLADEWFPALPADQRAELWFRAGEEATAAGEPEAAEAWLRRLGLRALQEQRASRGAGEGEGEPLPGWVPAPPPRVRRP